MTQTTQETLNFESMLRSTLPDYHEPGISPLQDIFAGTQANNFPEIGLPDNRATRVATGLAVTAVAGVGLYSLIGNTTPEALAVQRGNISEQLDGRLGRVVGKQFVTLQTKHSIAIEADAAWLENYKKTCQFAIDPFKALANTRNDPYPTNRIYRDMKRGGKALTHANKYLKENGGKIRIRVDKCDGDPAEITTSQLPAFEAYAVIGVKDFEKEATLIRARTRTTGMPRAWWDFRVREMNKSYFEDFKGITITLPWPDLAPASLGLRIKFGERTALRFPIGSAQNRLNPVGTPTLKPHRIGFRDVRAEVGG